MVFIIEELLKALPENRLLTESRFDYEKWSFAITFTDGIVAFSGLLSISILCVMEYPKTRICVERTLMKVMHLR